ncbi:PREDICTED: uncharacterized protein LOC105560603 [Vollenhovia emeryi]|uniref:uncharacterized protein LOC105560603 n=1 Tax=Vollenhovia emeryi TaxID=411798 RepID=UPI0005F3C5C9|nr:PREDICTED: uncharacterized protein LOC105560603 [Vollenhovia emeryi]
MADRVKLLVQRRTSLKSQITNLANLVEKGKLDRATLKLRIARLTELHRAFEEYNDELEVLDANEQHRNEFTQIRDRFYALAGKVDNILNPASVSSNGSSASNGENRADGIESVPKRRIKLPEAPLPTFEGKFENWLSFKNSFHDMIGSRSDLSDIDKLQYLKSALTGEAANKIKIFTIDGTTYSKAWELLERAYEVKRVLISRHLSSIINMPTLERETTNGLSKLADDAQQHLASLSVLGVSVGHEMIVHILESKLPRTTVEKWEASLERDEFPKVDQLYEFLYKTAVCVSKRDRSRSFETERSKNDTPAKKKLRSSNQAFVLNTSRNCVACKAKRHPLFVCDKFKQLPVPKRIELVRSAKVCYNCVRSHRDRPCKFSRCSICQKRHNTLLHLDNYKSVDKSETAQSATTTSQ